MKSLFGFIVFLIITSGIFYAQEANKIVIGERITVFSKILNEERPIIISVPFEYDNSLKKYPVVYFTDGSDYKVLSSGGLVHYFGYYRIPEMITVYIPNTDRGRDLSLYPFDQLPNSGGADNFLNFIAGELIPYIDKNYRTTDYRILVGSSAGAEFTFYSLLTKPDFFDAYIAASLCVFEEDKVLEKTKLFFENHKTLNKFLFIPYFEKDFTIATTIIPKIEKIISENLPRDFRFYTKKYQGQGHVPETAFLDGLTILFKDWRHVKEPEIIPSNGVIKEGKSINVEIKGFDTFIRYTLDRSEPTSESTLYTGPIKISEPVILRAKSFRENLGESDGVTAEFKPEGSILPQVEFDDVQPGLIYKYFDKTWFRLPDNISLEPTKKGITNDFNINDREKNQGFLYQLEGLLHIVKEGSYRFYVLTTVKSKLFLIDTVIVDINAGKSTADPLYDKEEYSYEIWLTPGYYPVKILYTNPWMNGSDFKVSYEGPGIPKQEIPPEVLFHKKS